MGRMTTALVLGLVLAAAVAGVLYYRGHRGEHQPGRGTPWTVLQDVEADHRADADHDTPLLLAHPEDSSYYVLGLPTGDATFPRAWILLNEHSADGTFKRMPASSSFHVDCPYVDSLIASTPVDEPVQRFLKRQCGR